MYTFIYIGIGKLINLKENSLPAFSTVVYYYYVFMPNYENKSF